MSTSTAVQTAPKQEKVYFSSRSGHRKVKTKPIAPSAEAASSLSRKLSVFKEITHSALPGRPRKQSDASVATEKSGLTGKSSSSTIWGSTSLASGNILYDYVHEITEPPSSAKTSPRGSRSGSVQISNPSGSVHSADSIHSLSEEDRRPSSATFTPSIRNSTHSVQSSVQSSERRDSLVEGKWWDDQRIESTVTEQYITAKIPLIEGAGLRAKLQAPVSFGDGLTETTYVEWISTRARKLFLILCELGIPEQIFGIVDDSLADDDLPLSAKAIPNLRLCLPEDPEMDRRFDKAQYTYLLRFLYHGTHIDFEEYETVPLEVVDPKQKDKLLPITHHTDKVRSPRDPTVVYTRRKFALLDRGVAEDFMSEVEAMRTVSHQHIVELYASYTYQGYGYLLLSPATDFNLRTFMQHTPAGFKRLTEDSRRFKLLDWMHCLADALAYLYDKGVSHRDIRPKSVVVDPETGNIYFGDIGSDRRLDITPLKVLQASENEKYEYGAPELWLRTIQHNISTAPTQLHYDGGRTGRKGVTLVTSTGSTPADLLRRVVSPAHNASVSPPSSPIQLEPTRRPSVASIQTTSSFHSNRSNATDGPRSPKEVQSVSAGAVKLNEWSSRPDQKSDVFSLGCIFLDMLTFHSHKKSLSSFPAARAKHKRAAGSRGGGAPDSSFHSNLDTVSEWIKDLKKEALKRDDDAVMAACILVTRMLEREPEDRPTPREVGDRLFSIMKTVKKSHCELHEPWQTDDSSASFSNWSGWDDIHDYHNHDDHRHSHPNSSVHLHLHGRKDSRSAEDPRGSLSRHDSVNSSAQDVNRQY